MDRIGTSGKIKTGGLTSPFFGGKDDLDKRGK
jgi:hypothetical protein